MRRTCLLFCIVLIFISLDAKCPKRKGKKRHPIALQEVVVTPPNYITSYKGAYQKYFDLIHTKLLLKPVFKEKALYGIAELTLKPHYYEQNKLVLDAKYLKINEVQLKTKDNYKKLSFSYDTSLLTIDLNKYYTRNDQITISINYVALPYTQDSLQVEEGRGMYFIDVEGKNPYKPMHLWTQGEEESSSCWFPTIDATDQKTTEEIYVTLDTNMVSLSNGLLMSSTQNGDGTKTDYWKQDKPHSPYLFFLGIGDYYIHKDKWRDKEVIAYTFPKYKKDVGEIFKNMPAMMEYYSQLLGVDFPWDKMANIMAYDYTAGAMENSSAILYFDKMLCTHQQLIDGGFDWIIAHELFHQWFGDYVTPKSWANLTLSESFANYGEYLWYNFKEGNDIGDAYLYSCNQKYIHSSTYKNEPLVNFYYDAPKDVFDAIRYEKGGAVLHMLRNYVGDAAFFASLNKYLTTHKFGNAEVSDLRKCFEEITGEDLNWFFNQWWYSKGHPILNIQHRYDAQNKTIELTVIQTQKNDFGPIFRIPVKIDIYTNGKKETKTIDITNSTNKFYFSATAAPQLINFDADKKLLCEKTEDLSDAENIFKFYNAPLYLDKLEAIKALAIHQKENPAAQEVLLKAMQDKNWYLRKEAVEAIQPDKFSDKVQLSLALQNTIQTDVSPRVREKAIHKLVNLDKGQSINTLKRVLDADSSILCLSAALENINYYHKAAAYEYAKRLSITEAPELMQAIAAVFKDTIADNLEFFKKAIWLNTNRTFYYNFKSFGEYLKKSDAVILENGIRFLADIYQYEESDYNKQGAKQVVQNLEFYFSEKAKKSPDDDKKWKMIKLISATLQN